MRALQENGYKIPEDISVMGFDNTELSGYTNPPLTTVNEMCIRDRYLSV